MSRALMGPIQGPLANTLLDISLFWESWDQKTRNFFLFCISFAACFLLFLLFLLCLAHDMDNSWKSKQGNWFCAFSIFLKEHKILLLLHLTLSPFILTCDYREKQNLLKENLNIFVTCHNVMQKKTWSSNLSTMIHLLKYRYIQTLIITYLRNVPIVLWYTLLKHLVCHHWIENALYRICILQTINGDWINK